MQQVGPDVVEQAAAAPDETHVPISGHRHFQTVGIATGETYVGTLRTVDRSLWVALGNTTNLAARLESATRKLGVSVVIDDVTWEAAGDAAADFSAHPALAVKGRRAQIDVHTWTTAALAASLAEEQ